MPKPPLTEAEARIKKRAEQAKDGLKATAEYEAAAVAQREKTAKLRALRLAKEAKDAAEAQVEPKPVKKTKAKKKAE
ncbi:MAG: transcriptional regulator [Proteobacteria bacterium]|nr:transcriptional regulator [Pseudomonadota bacterium]